MNISMRIRTDVRPRGNGYAARAFHMPVYTYVDDLTDLNQQVNDALQLWCAGFPTSDDLLAYLDANEIAYSIEGHESVPVGWTPLEYTEYQVALA